MAKIRPHSWVKKFFLDFYRKLERKWSILKKNLLKNLRKMKSSEFFKKRLKFAICKNTFVLRFYLLQSGVEAEITTPIDFSVKKLTFLSFAPMKIARGIWCNAKYLISRAVASGPLKLASIFMYILQWSFIIYLSFSKMELYWREKMLFEVTKLLNPMLRYDLFSVRPEFRT